MRRLLVVSVALTACAPAVVADTLATTAVPVVTTTSTTTTTLPPTSTVAPSTSTSATSTTSTTSTTIAATTSTTLAPTTTRPRPTTTTTTLPPPTFLTATGVGPVVGASGPLRTYTVAVEEGIDLDVHGLAAIVDSILGDERSWTAVLEVRVQRVEMSPNTRIVIATPATVDRLCAPLPTKGSLSCFRSPYVVLNATRWVQGAATWGADIDGYRGYLVNHEFGHSLGRQHVSCPGAGLPAPVMVQQTISLGGCLPNSWPAITGG